MPLPVLSGEFVSRGSYAYQQKTGLILDLTIPCPARHRRKPVVWPTPP